MYQFPSLFQFPTQDPIRFNPPRAQSNFHNRVYSIFLHRNPFAKLGQESIRFSEAKVRLICLGQSPFHFTQTPTLFVLPTQEPISY